MESDHRHTVHASNKLSPPVALGNYRLMTIFLPILANNLTSTCINEAMNPVQQTPPYDLYCFPQHTVLVDCDLVSAATSMKTPQL